MQAIFGIHLNVAYVKVRQVSNYSWSKIDFLCSLFAVIKRNALNATVTFRYSRQTIP